MDAAVGEVDTTDEPDADPQAQNDTGFDDLSIVNLDCTDTSFDGNAAGERGGTIYSTTVSNSLLRLGFGVAKEYGMYPFRVIYSDGMRLLLCP